MGASTSIAGFLLTTSIFFAAGAQFVNAAAVEAKPNIILISIDTLAAEHMGVYGYSRPTTPFLRNFARENVLFENTFSQAPYTLASHYSIFTGLYADTHNIVNEGTEPMLDPKYKTITEHLKASGYRTVWAGTTTNPQLDVKRGLVRGFDEVHNLIFEMGPGQRAVTALLKTLPGKPFFLFLHTYMVHDPYHPIAPFNKLFDPGFKRHIEFKEDKLLAMREGGMLVDPEESPRRRVRNNFLSQFNLSDPKERGHIVSLYDGGVRTVDDAMKEVFGTLKKLGLYDNSLIVVTSDHGETFGQRGYYYHVETSREEIHVPLIMKVPGVRPARIAQTTLSIDILPTILDFLHIAPPTSLEGRSLLPLMLGKPFSREEYSFSHGMDCMDAVWNADWKLRFSLGNGAPHLYYIRNDPTEQNDLAPIRIEVVERLKGVLDAFKLNRTHH